MKSEINLEFEQGEDGRWIAEAIEIPGALACGITQEESRAKARAFANLVRNQKDPME